MEKIQEAQQGKGIATILAIGTANPPTSILQSDYPDFYFRVTGSSDHMPDLEYKFRKICANSAVRKRHMLHNEGMLKQNPSMCTYGAPSFNTRQSILYEEVPKLGKEAALKAINEWGQPISKITHLIFYTTSSFGNVPGADYHLSILLGLHPTVNRLMIFNLGCYAGGTLLRLSKDITENNAGSRVLAVCVETMAASFHGPSATHLDILVGQALFGDGAAAMIIGADPNPHIESPLFELVLASQTTIPETEKGIHGGPREMGMVYYLAKAVPTIVSENVEKCLVDAFSSIGNISDWNSLFYAVHPGGPAILREIEEKLGLQKEKLRASKHVLSEYGNMWSSSVIFVLDEMRRNSMSEGKTTTGEGLEWGVLLGLGPGLTVETVVLRSISLN